MPCAPLPAPAVRATETFPYALVPAKQMSLPATPGPDEARESVVQQIAGALAAEQDSVVELGRDGAFAERY